MIALATTRHSNIEINKTINDSRQHTNLGIAMIESYFAVYDICTSLTLFFYIQYRFHPFLVLFPLATIFIISPMHQMESIIMLASSMVTFTALYKLPVKKQSYVGITSLAYIAVIVSTQLMILMCYYRGSFALAFLAQTMFDYSLVARNEEEWFRQKSYLRLVLLLCLHLSNKEVYYSLIGLIVPIVHAAYMHFRYK